MNEETVRLALRQGDKDVFVHLYNLYGDRLFRTAFLLCVGKIWPKICMTMTGS